MTQPGAGSYEVQRVRGVRVPGAHGCTLLTDHYRPVAQGRFPTLLVRSPYGRGFPYAGIYGAAYARHGFHVLLQSCRGTAGSMGEFVWFRNETEDGLATVAWLREQPWFTGVLGTVGASYLGFTQWALARQAPPELRAMVIQAGLHDPYGSYYPGGALALESSLVSAAALRHQSRGALRALGAARELQRQLPQAIGRLPLIESSAELDQVLRQTRRSDPLWTDTDVGSSADGLDVPTMLVAGWYDILLDQNLVQYGRLRAAGCATALVIGPWTHASMLDHGGPIVHAASLGWLREHLAGDVRRDEAGRAPSRVRVHVGGVDEWRDLPDWPPPATMRRLHLHDGRLDPTPPGTGEPVGRYRYDPADPTPSVGGPLMSPDAGPRDNAILEARPDVLTFTTEPLREPVEVMGPVRSRLRIATPKGSCIDVFARLCDVDTDGRSTNVCDGLLRLPASGGGPEEVTVAMNSTAYRFAAGHRIRLQVSSGAHPRFARNTGTGEPFATTTRLVATDVAVLGGSALLLPVVSPPH